MIKNSKLYEEFDKLVPYREIPLFVPEATVEKGEGNLFGVLKSGQPYVSESALAAMCGVDRKVLSRLSANWPEESEKPRGSWIKQRLAESGFTESELSIKVRHNGRDVNAYTEQVCMAVIEFYAFESNEPREKAKNLFRTLAKTSFRQFIYALVGYAPTTSVIDSWRNFHDKVDLVSNQVPEGYFCIFTEIACLIIPLIRNGLVFSDEVIPDISVALCWGRFWVDNDLDNKIGSRVKYAHNYPPYYRQAASNPQKAWAYPEDALPLFRRWFRSEYIDRALPKYLQRQVCKNQIQQVEAAKAISVIGAHFSSLPKPIAP